MKEGQRGEEQSLENSDSFTLFSSPLCPVEEMKRKAVSRDERGAEEEREEKSSVR